MNINIFEDSSRKIKPQSKFRILFASSLVICILCLFTLAGCAGNRISATDLAQGIEPDETVEPTSLNTSDIAKLNDFGIKAFKYIDGGTSNTCISPLSIEYALGMTANGAGGQTRTQMEDVLGASVDDINVILNDLRIATEEQMDESDAGPEGNSSEQAESNDGETITKPLHIANSLWIKDGIDVEQSFLKTNATYYDAGIFQTPFDSTSLHDINEWVSNNTDGMIDQLLDKISPSAAMYLINALAFEATWVVTYKAEDVNSRIFTDANGNEQRVSFMDSTEYIYLEGANATGFIKPYTQGSYAFAALLPDEGTSVDELISNLDGDTLTNILSNTYDTTVSTRTPKFESEFSTDLKDVLSEMDMPDAFNDKANFSGISKTDDLCIGSVMHKTYIKVDEEGTKASATTGSEIQLLSAKGYYGEKTVCLDRPFVYMIIDRDTDAVIFIGTVRELE